MTAIILTNGKKPLIRDLYPDLPTSLIPVLDEPFLHWVTQWIKSQGFNQIVYATDQHSDKLDIWVNEAASSETNLCMDVVKEPHPHGTAAAAVMCAKRFPADIFLIVNAENLLPINLTPALAKMQNDKTIDGILWSTSTNNSGRFGSLVLDCNNQLLNINNKSIGKNLINTGVYLMRQSLLNNIQTDIEHNLEKDCISKWIESNKKFEVINASEPFIEIGTPETLQKAYKQIAEYKQKISKPIIEEAV